MPCFLRTLPAACLAAPILAAPLEAAPQPVEACDLRASARNLAEPWEENTLTFAEGAVRVAVIDMIEPAGGAYYLLVLSPPTNEIGDRQCRFVSASTGIGFAGIEMEGTEASYDPARGLTLDVPASIWTASDPDLPPLGTLTVTINQATGDVTASHSR